MSMPLEVGFIHEDFHGFVHGSALRGPVGPKVNDVKDVSLSLEWKLILDTESLFLRGSTSSTLRRIAFDCSKES